MLHKAKELVEQGEDVLFVIADRREWLAGLLSTGDSILTKHIRSELLKCKADSSGGNGKLAVKEIMILSGICKKVEKKMRKWNVFVDEAKLDKDLFRLLRNLDKSQDELEKCLWIALEPSSCKEFEPLGCFVTLPKCFRNEHNIIRYVQPELDPGHGQDLCHSRSKVMTVICEAAKKKKEKHHFEAFVSTILLISARVSQVLFVVSDDFQARPSIQRKLTKNDSVRTAFPGGVVSNCSSTDVKLIHLFRPKRTLGGVPGRKMIVLTDSPSIAGCETEAVLRLGLDEQDEWYKSFVSADMARATTTLVDLIDEDTLKRGYLGSKVDVRPIQEGYLFTAGGKLVSLTTEQTQDLQGGRQSVQDISRALSADL